LKYLFREAGEPLLRRGPEGEIALSDGGHYIADVTCPPIPDPGYLEKKLKLLPGVIETGLFCGMASLALVGGPAGVRRLNPVQSDGDVS
ncbi:MAG: ribose-5-phosphate isomerase A, partial [Synergistota bacterium]|nr:ribose-5-phosphate isomerase A [Synergistota bacterium]